MLMNSQAASQLPKTISFHIDIDSPAKLLRYYGFDDVSFSDDQLSTF